MDEQNNDLTQKGNEISLATRAFLALGLTVVFYFLAIAIAIFLLFIPYSMIVYLGRINAQIFLVCIVGAFLIIWSIIPRREKFIASGPILSKEEYPVLHEEINNIAKSLGQENPAEIYLVPEMNAWVSNVGGFFGFGSKRIMGLGLPLIEVLNMSELRAIIAHEFGHYHRGDTKLGPWIYRTRSTIVRTVQNLQVENSLITIIHYPFKWYALLFLRVTNAISRNQEYAADKLAVSLTDPVSFESGLKKITGSSNAYSRFWNEDYVPLLSLGYILPYAEGINEYLSKKEVQKEIEKEIENEINERKSNPYDTHPILKDRINAIKQVTLTDKSSIDKRKASILINDLKNTEKKLFSSIVKRTDGKDLISIDWDDSGKVYIEQWKKVHITNKAVVEGFLFEDLSLVYFNINNFISKIKDNPVFTDIEVKIKRPITPQEKINLIVPELSRSLVLALISKGWKITSLPGELSLSKGKEKIFPFELAGQAVSGKIPPSEWEKICKKFDIDKIDAGMI